MLRLPDVRLWPGVRYPTCPSSGQSVCSGCGSLCMLWVRESLLMKVTWPPALIVTVWGLTPLEVMVIVAIEDGGAAGVGAVAEPELEPPAQAAAAAAVTASAS